MKGEQGLDGLPGPQGENYEVSQDKYSYEFVNQSQILEYNLLLLLIMIFTIIKNL